MCVTLALQFLRLNWSVTLLACRLLDLYGRGKVVFTQGLFWVSYCSFVTLHCLSEAYFRMIWSREIERPKQEKEWENTRRETFSLFYLLTCLMLRNIPWTKICFAWLSASVWLWHFDWYWWIQHIRIDTTTLSTESWWFIVFGVSSRSGSNSICLIFCLLKASECFEQSACRLI